MTSARWPGFNEAAGFTRRKHRRQTPMGAGAPRTFMASMRPPDLPGGNLGPTILTQQHSLPSCQCFNEAAGFTRRKRREPCSCLVDGILSSFNEAAGFTRRKPGAGLAALCASVDALNASMRPPDLPGGKHPGAGATLAHVAATLRASMRPPDLPGGNPDGARTRNAWRSHRRFNEAAGFTRRKRGSWRTFGTWRASAAVASMRPPDLPGGNTRRCRYPYTARARTRPASMRPPDLPGGNTVAAAVIRVRQLRDLALQ